MKKMNLTHQWWNKPLTYSPQETEEEAEEQMFNNINHRVKRQFKSCDSI